MADAEKFNAITCYNKSATIAASGTTSAEVDLEGTTLCGLIMPATFTGTTITFQMSDDSGGTFVLMHDGAGASYSKTVATSKYIPLNPADFAGMRYIKLVSGSTESSQRVIKLATRPV